MISGALKKGYRIKDSATSENEYINASRDDLIIRNIRIFKIY